MWSYHRHIIFYYETSTNCSSSDDCIHIKLVYLSYRTCYLVRDALLVSIWKCSLIWTYNLWWSCNNLMLWNYLRTFHSILLQPKKYFYVIHQMSRRYITNLLILFWYFNYILSTYILCVSMPCCVCINSIGTFVNFVELFELFETVI